MNMKTQGIKKYCDKEGYIVEIFRNKEALFKDIVGINVKNIHSEVRLNKNKIRVDLICEVDDGSLAFIEVSIRHNCVKDFVTHRNQLINILSIIGKNKFAQIVLMAPDFLNEDIKDIEELITYYNIKVYFVYIPIELILKVQNHINIGFNEKDKLKYYQPTVGKCITVTSKVVNQDKKFILHLNNEHCGNSIAKAILKGLREEVYWHLAVHNFKDLTKNIIRIGTGTSDIILNIYCNMDDKIKVELDFAQRLDVFSVFKDYMADMCNEIGNSIDLASNKPKIFTEIPMFKNKKITIDKAVTTAKSYLEYITKMYRKIQL